MEVVEADDGGHVGDEGVGLAADVVELALATEAGRHAAHEGRLAAARVSRQACIRNTLGTHEEHIRSLSQRPGLHSYTSMCFRLERSRLTLDAISLGFRVWGLGLGFEV